MAAKAIMVHRVPGRTRLRIDEKRGDAAYFSDLSERLGGFGNVVSAKANPVTGSITFRFTGSLEDILRLAKEQDLLLVTEASGGNDHVALKAGWMASPTWNFAAGSRSINLVSGRDINRDFMTGSLMLLIGLVQMFRGQWFPPALSVLWYARGAFDLANARRPAKAG